MRPFPAGGCNGQTRFHLAAAFAFFMCANLAYVAFPSTVVAPASSYVHEAAGKPALPYAPLDSFPAGHATVKALDIENLATASPRFSPFPLESPIVYGDQGITPVHAGDLQDRLGDEQPRDGTAPGVERTLTKPKETQAPQQRDSVPLGRNPKTGVRTTGKDRTADAERVAAVANSDVSLSKQEAGTDRTLLFIPHSGLSNQLIILRKAVTVAAIYNRTLIVPPLQSSHLKQAPTLIEQGVSEDGNFVGVQVQEGEMVKPENDFRQWLDFTSDCQAAVKFISLQEHVKRTKRVYYRCWNVKGPFSLTKVDTNIAWKRMVEEEDVLCVGRPFKFKVRGRFVADYLRFSETVRAVGDAWLELNDLGPGRKDFIAAHIRRGDFGVYYCKKKGLPGKTCRPTYDEMFAQVDDLRRRVSTAAAASQHPKRKTWHPEIPIVFMTNEKSKEKLARMSRLGWRRFSPSDFDARLLVMHGAKLGIPEFEQDGKTPRTATANEMGMLQILVDQYIGTQATYFIGNRHSTFSLIVQQFRDCIAPHACEHWGEASS